MGQADQQYLQLPDKAKYIKAVGVADTGTSVLCAGKSIMRRMGVEEKQLCPTTNIIRVANQIKLNVLGMVPVTVQVVGHPERQTIQALYIAQELISRSMRSSKWRMLEI